MGGWKRNGEGLRRQSWRWKKMCVLEGVFGKGGREKGVNGGVRKLGE